MKLKVLKKFRDKYTDKTYEVGSIIEPTDKRAEELLAVKGGLVELVEGGKPATKKTRFRK